MEPPFILALIIGSLGIVAWFLIRDWKKTWEDRVIAHDTRLDGHDKTLSKQAVLNAKIEKDLEYIKEAGDETRLNVKELLRQNGRNTG